MSLGISNVGNENARETHADDERREQDADIARLRRHSWSSLKFASQISSHSPSTNRQASSNPSLQSMITRCQLSSLKPCSIAHESHTMSHTMSVYDVGPRTAILESQLTATVTMRERTARTPCRKKGGEQAVGTERHLGGASVPRYDRVSKCRDPTGLMPPTPPFSPPPHRPVIGWRRAEQQRGRAAAETAERPCGSCALPGRMVGIRRNGGGGGGSGTAYDGLVPLVCLGDWKIGPFRVNEISSPRFAFERDQLAQVPGISDARLFYGIPRECELGKVKGALGLLRYYGDSVKLYGLAQVQAGVTRGNACYAESRNKKGAAYVSTEKNAWQGHINIRINEEMENEYLNDGVEAYKEKREARIKEVRRGNAFYAESRKRKEAAYVSTGKMCGIDMEIWVSLKRWRMNKW
ncbi:hypothetical protein WN48_01659 [Eufriesea mexicana]|uniref:Uncharacterized protein n=1 Tax=Eufriesea mexicana TaxID=516756 RepID=A0A310S4Z8_9HYME|nr:hypothetical protein WN48_01659 [Eufriesea mexicana]